MKAIKLAGVLLLFFSCQSERSVEVEIENNKVYTGPIIDMHIHAEGDNTLPPDRLGLCIPLSNLVPHFDPKQEFGEAWSSALINPDCDEPVWSAKSFDDYSSRLEELLNKYKVTPMMCGSDSILKLWSSKFGDQIIKGLEFQIGNDNISVDSVKHIIEKNDIQIFGEIKNQYAGIAPNDPQMDSYYAMAQEMDIPVAIHLGSGAPGSPYLFSPDYLAALSNPLLLEEVLKKYPRLRVCVMHYGEPFVDEMITMMYHYPQIYVDLGGIHWAYPQEYFYEYHLRKMVSAGFGKRIMFGSDTFIWPDLLEKSIAIINEADFLTHDQKADIFYNNASRFLRLEK